MKVFEPTDRSTLLLDSAWMPIDTITARACLHHFIRDRVTGIDKNRSQFNFEDWNAGGNSDGSVAIIPANFAGRNFPRIY